MVVVVDAVVVAIGMAVVMLVVVVMDLVVFPAEVVEMVVLVVAATWLVQLAKNGKIFQLIQTEILIPNRKYLDVPYIFTTFIKKKWKKLLFRMYSVFYIETYTQTSI